MMPNIPHIGVVFPFIGLLSFLFLDDFDGNAKISAAIKSGSTVVQLVYTLYIHCQLSGIVMLCEDSTTCGFACQCKSDTRN